jgi:small subunit ribosomal protein S18
VSNRGFDDLDDMDMGDDFDGGRRGGRSDRFRRGGFGRDGGDDRRGGGNRRRQKHAEYCPEGKCFDYKDVDTLRKFVTETGKIRPRRQTGNCARCQRSLAREIKRARHLALLPFVNATD